MSDDEYERKPRQADGIAKPPEPDNGGSDGEDYERRPKNRPDPKANPGRSGIDENAPLNHPGLSPPLGSKFQGDGPGSAQKDVMRPGSEYDNTPLPTLGGPAPGEPKKETNFAILPDSVKVRTVIINIVCYLNVLFLLIYFPGTV
jgi:hypothetical protein